MSHNREIFLCFVVLVVGTACAASLVRTMGMQGAEAAAWAQAIGTVGAIAATGHFATKQIAAQALQKRADRIELIDSIREAAHFSLDTWYILDHALESRSREALGVALGHTQFTPAAPFDGFLAMPVERWPSPFVYMRAQQYKAASEKLWATARNTFKPTLDDQDWAVLRGARNQVQVARSMLDDVCVALRNRLVSV